MGRTCTPSPWFSAAVPIQIFFRGRVHRIPYVLSLNALFFIELVIVKAVVEVDLASLNLFLAHLSQLFQLASEKTLNSHETSNLWVKVLVDKIHASLVNFMKNSMDLRGWTSTIVLDSLPTHLEVTLLSRATPPEFTTKLHHFFVSMRSHRNQTIVGIEHDG